ncbi:uncharacterized protein LOC131671774 [Phymastichus coffea]|uniref:uncharacterized protein LOC131671774 n=1 Tax=Phymastichus coffea TaxID=108790 RepID=UPI00273B01D5|nr:uncharacterized protein LOC131671774 [Phymastichus coffea]
MKSVLVTLLLLALVASSSVRASEETSDLYLRNVVEELQFLNGLVPSDRSTRVSYPTDQELPTIGEASVESAASASLPQHQIARKPPSTYLTEPPQPPQPPQASPMLLGFTAAELAAMYRKALQTGVSVKHNNAEYSFDRTKVVPALRVQQPTYGSNYAYYFYPLNSFRHELEKQTAGFPAVVSDGYHTLPDSAYAATTITDHVKKESSNNGIMNHIITGVSSFIGMAIFFIFSMFIYPRFLHMMHFPFVATSRTNFRNELSHLTAFVTEAIDAYNQNIKKKSKHRPQR